MKRVCDILFPALLAASVLLSIGAEAKFAPVSESVSSAAQDTVLYVPDSYRLHRRGVFSEVEIADSLLMGMPDSLDYGSSAQEDSARVILARDTIRVPDSLKLTDPWRYKYYLALVDSLSRRLVCDSLKVEADTAYARLDSILAAGCLEDIRLIDSIYCADSAARVAKAFEDWYGSLSKAERKKYDFTVKEKARMAEQDSIRILKEKQKAEKDSLLKATPRVLDTYGLPKELHYKRIVAWTVDRTYGENRPYVPDTTFNTHFYDRRFQTSDVNATWLGVDGSPVQYYDYFKRSAESAGCVFYDSFEPWTYNPETFIQYNTKSPYTEFGYYGTLLSTGSKEQDNVRFLCTQNITPALNFSILYERFGGGGMLVNETVRNKTFAAGLNHQGRRYVMNTGFISNSVNMGENCGIVDNTWIRDTTVDVREVSVADTKGSSVSKKSTWYLNHRYSMPFLFINDILAKQDSSLVSDDITTLYLGNDVEYSSFTRQYTPKTNLTDSLGMGHFEAKAYLRLQPWSRNALLSKIDAGVGEYTDTYLNRTPAGTGRVSLSSAYAYAAAGGNVRGSFDWDARASLVFAGADMGDASVSGRMGLKLHPFRKARNSPLTIEASASTSLSNPTFYQYHQYSNDKTFRWDLDLAKVSETRIEGSVDVPYWKFDAKVGYAVLTNNLYYTDPGVLMQNPDAMGVFSAGMRKDFCIGGWLHLDNRLLYQYSSRQDVVPVPALAANLRWYAQFVVQKAEDGVSDVMVMQLGVNAFANTPWYAPGWNPVLATFYNQADQKYTNGPWFDIFMNIQWKKACIFVKLQNAGMGWPMKSADYFSAHGHIITQGGMPGLKLGITWPFYPDKPMKTVKL